jgi:hypothetical protein
MALLAGAVRGGNRAIQGGTVGAAPRYRGDQYRRNIMGLGRGLLLWLIGIPLPIILLLALFWR